MSDAKTARDLLYPVLVAALQKDSCLDGKLTVSHGNVCAVAWMKGAADDDKLGMVIATGEEVSDGSYKEQFMPRLTGLLDTVRAK